MTTLAEAFHHGFKAGRDYMLWAERSSDEKTRPNTLNPYDGGDEIDPDFEAGLNP
ncbi:hypothetical protein [Nocardia sp. NPDC059239]|uniref:hypothetical protein n=1 Tax=unclassified Nocardia TaxID=2637762 RepID=UPI0036CD5A67